MMERVEVAPGVVLAVDRWRGRGAPTGLPPMVLVHGLASNARMWDGVADRLVARGHDVVTVDLRGHGRSSKPDAGYDVGTVARDLGALIGRLGLDRPVVAGQSWGGNVVLQLAATDADRIGGIACVDGGWLDLQARFPGWESCRAALAPPRLAGRPLADVEGYIRAAHPDWPETGIRGTLANFEVRADGTIAPWLTFERHLDVLRGLWEHRPGELYAAIAAPVLLIPATSGDPAASDDKRRAVAAAETAIQRARVHWLTGDHDIHAQHPIEVGDVMHDATTDGFFTREAARA